MHWLVLGILFLGFGDEALIEKLIISYKRGKFIEKLYGKFTDKHIHREDSMKRALAMKYQTFMSRRKFRKGLSILTHRSGPKMPLHMANTI